MVQHSKYSQNRVAVIIAVISVVVCFVVVSARIFALMHSCANRATDDYAKMLEMDSEKTYEYMRILESLGIKLD